MSKTLRVPTPSKNISRWIDVSIEKGRVLFVLGANGTGKSSLIYHSMKNSLSTDNVVLVSAHRQIWFEETVIDMSNSEYEQISNYLLSNVRYTNEYRWKVNDARQSKLPIIRLKKSINRRNRDIADKVDTGDLDGAIKASKSPKEIINTVLHSSGFPISIEINDEDNLSVLNSKYDPPARYSISELSDGEKNAITIAADVISSLPGTLFIIDEPERHLHRSVSSPLLAELISLRTDCYFLISTHDIALASDMKNSQVLIVKSCEYSENNASAWDVELITEPESIPDSIRKDILGARKDIIFIEGINTSLDVGLYKSLFPNATLIPKEGCEDVSISVSGIRRNEKLGWLNAYGLVDNDNKKQEEISSLKSGHVFTLKYHSVESIFYHPTMISTFIKRYGDIFDTPKNALEKINSEVIRVLDNPDKMQDLCSLAVNKSVRWSFNQFIPSHKGGFENKQITINAGDIYAEELKIYKDAIARGDVKFLIERYSIRRSGILDRIIKILNCTNRDLYESKIMSLVREDVEARKFVIQCLAGLYEKIHEGQDENHNQSIG